MALLVLKGPLLVAIAVVPKGEALGATSKVLLVCDRTPKVLDDGAVWANEPKLAVAWGLELPNTLLEAATFVLPNVDWPNTEVVGWKIKDNYNLILHCNYSFEIFIYKKFIKLFEHIYVSIANFNNLIKIIF